MQVELDDKRDVKTLAPKKVETHLSLLLHSKDTSRLHYLIGSRTVLISHNATNWHCGLLLMTYARAEPDVRRKEFPLAQSLENNGI